MLPERLLPIQLREDEIVPRFLGPNDVLWVRDLIQDLDGFVGESVDALEQAEDGLIHECRQKGASFRAAKGMMRILSRAWPRQVVAPARPIEVRKLLFENIGSGMPRHRALECTASKLGIQTDEVLSCLFADRSTQRCIQPAENLPNPIDMLDQFNLELVQGLLARSETVGVLVKDSLPSIVRFAKFKGLLCSYAVEQNATTIELSGPLSLFRNTTKYGNALAAFFPVLIATPGWSLTASCLLHPVPWQEEAQTDALYRYRLLLDASIPVRGGHTPPADTQNAQEKRLLKQIRDVRRGWKVERQSQAIQAGKEVFFPDFKLFRGNQEVFVEVQGFFTSEYLEKKLHALKQAGLRHYIVCVSPGFACDEGNMVSDSLLLYDKRIDAMVLLDKAEAMVRNSSPPSITI